MEHGLSHHNWNLFCVSKSNIRKVTCTHIYRETAHLERLEGASACDEVAAIVQSSDSIVFDALSIAQRKRKCILLTRAGSDEESAAGVARDE